MFQETYRSMNDAIVPPPALAAEAAASTKTGVRPRLRGTAAVAAVLALALCVGTPVAAATVEPVYQMLYLLSPSAAQLFQPVRRTCADGGVTMEVAAVSVEGSRAQAVIALSGGAVDETTDLFDSYSFHLPFDQTSHCRRAGFDPETGTAYFQITTETMDGSPIPGGKMTVSLRSFLSGKEAAEDLAVELDLGACARSAPTTGDVQSLGGGGADRQELEETRMLEPGGPLALPVEGIPVTAAGYAGAFFRVQVRPEDRNTTDNHCSLYLMDGAGNQVQPAASLYFRSAETADGPEQDYVDFLFDIPPSDLPDYTLYGSFYTSAHFTQGSWRVTFPLEDT